MSFSAEAIRQRIERRPAWMPQLGGAAYWLAPPLFCLFLYWLGLKAWFQQDDFAWLHLRLEVHNWQDLWNALFAPMAQGTIRPWSERLFFMTFSALFGMDPLPYRIWVFLTQFANLALLSLIAWRLTGSRAAGFWAAIFWTASRALAIPMTWTSAYNQILCCLFLLSSFYLLLGHIRTGRRSYEVAQWITFLLGFGALEVNLVYPALAAAYTLACARPYFRRTLPLFVPSLAFVALRQSLAAPGAGPYHMHFDAGILATLWTYWERALGPAQWLPALAVPPSWLVPVGTAILTLAILGFTTWKSLRREWLAAFLLFWFLSALAPVLPLREHIVDYYLTIPVLGLAFLGAWMFVSAWRGSWRWRVTGVVLAGIYLGVSVPVTSHVTGWWFERSQAVKRLVLGVARAQELHPGKAILLAGVDTNLFESAVAHQPFRLFGARHVYLTPGSESAIESRPEFGDISNFILPAAVARWALARDQAVVYVAGGARLRNATSRYQELAMFVWTREEPRRVDVSNPLFANQLGPGWHELEQGARRWMSGRATVRLGGPPAPGQRLYLVGYRPAGRSNQVTMKVSVYGRALPPALLTGNAPRFELAFLLPPEAVGRPSLEVSIQVDPTFTPPGDGRKLGVTFGTLEIR